MEDVFRKLGYQNVRQSKKTGDEGRDILMEETVDGQQRGIVVECKHQHSVGRPVVQKLHSAVATYEFHGPKRGIVVTTGQVTEPAREYAERLRENGHDATIGFIDGTDLRDIADDIGLNLYNGRIEILCDQTLRPVDPAGGVEAPVREAFRSVKNLTPESLPKANSTVVYEPLVSIRARTDATFETSVGVVHEVDERDEVVVRAEADEPVIVDSNVAELVADGGAHTVSIESSSVEDTFGESSLGRFALTETGYKDWAVDHLRTKYTETVEYTGDNNVDYEKECEPKLSDVSVGSISSLYLPRVRSTTELQNYSYSLEYYAAGPSRHTIENGIGQCVHCGWRRFTDHTYCDNCGSINCRRHIKTEHTEGTPVCSGCATSERFALKKKYFYNDENLDAFREEYESMSLPEKALENKPMVASSVVFVLITLFMLV